MDHADITDQYNEGDVFYFRNEVENGAGKLEANCIGHLRKFIMAFSSLSTTE